jgi:hypothetical protein
MVTVCPEGQVLFTCERVERVSDSILYWDISVPHLAESRERFVPSPGVILSPEFKIGFTEFNITRTSESPLISQLLITNVSTEINGSSIHCSEDGNETNSAPMITINVKYKGIYHNNTALLWLLYACTNYYHTYRRYFA